MPSAGRPFTHRADHALVARRRRSSRRSRCTRGVSSPERDEPPYPERYRGARRDRAAGRTPCTSWGGRVIAVGTTVVRALETVAPPGRVASSPATGWTSLVVTPERGLRVVDGLLTGWHEPEASHLQMLEAAAGAELLERSYAGRCRARLSLARVRRHPPDPAVDGRDAANSAHACRTGPATSRTPRSASCARARSRRRRS